MREVSTLDEHFNTRLSAMSQKVEIERKSENKLEAVLFLPEGEGRQGEGGMRTQGYFKQTLTEKPLITVITVVFNGEEFLEETIQSVINQTYDNVEYIIIDGGSTDGTLDIIHKYEHVIDYWVSEKDKGIYYAMNKGIELATGDWINFMNGGDSFYSKSSLSSVFSAKNYDKIHIIYGNHEVLYSSGKKRMVKAGQVKKIWKGSQFCHQSAFINANYQKTHPFNLCERIVADWEFFYNAWKGGAKFHFVDMTVAKFGAGGVSDVKRVDSIVGRWNLVEKTLNINLHYIFLIVVELLKLLVKKG